MKLSKKVKTQRWIAVMALFITVVFLFSVFPILRLTKRSTASAAEAKAVSYTYIDTEVEGIAFYQGANSVYLGFRLTESDYSDCDPWGGEFTAPNLNQYMAQDLTYWKNFAQMNNEGAAFVQPYAYWNGSELGTAKFGGTVAHNSRLKRLEFGFSITIPAGTTFPSQAYVAAGCTGTPVAYRTKADKAFYFDGTAFAEMSYSIAEIRANAENELNNVNLNLYYETERAQVEALIDAAKEEIQLSFSKFAVDNAMDKFYTDLDKVATIQYYEELSLQKEADKEGIDAFFAEFSVSDYSDADWQKLLSIQNEGEALIDTAMSMEELASIVASIKYAANSVLTLEEKAGFAEYQAAAKGSLEEVCDGEVYREAEIAQREALIAEGKAAIEKASSFDEVDAIQFLYTSRIQELKTQAEWEEEEKNNASNGSNGGDKNEGSNVTIIAVDEEEDGCSGTIGGYGALVGVLAVAALMMIKKKKSEGERK